MKQVSQSMKEGRIQVLDVPPPALRPQGVLVRTAWSLISAGTERAKVDLGQKSLVAKARSRPDQVAQVLDKVRRDGLLQTYRTVMARLAEESPIGYSSAGVVMTAGDLAGGVKPGDRVACGGGDYANHAEIAYVPATLCVPVPEGVGLDEAAFATVGAVALQGIRQSGAGLGDRVAVIGLGLLGQLTVQMLRAAGCEVAGVDLNQGRCERALASGAQIALPPSDTAAAALLAAAGGYGYDCIIITAGTKDDGPVRLAGKIARDRGTVVIVGDVGMDIPRAPFYEKELTLKLSRSYGPGRYDPLYEEAGIDYPLGYVRWTEQRNMAEFLRLVADKKVDVQPLITHRFVIDAAAEAYAAVSQPGVDSLGVLLEYPATSEQPTRIVVGKPAKAPDKDSIGVGLLGAGNFATATLLPALAADLRFVPRGVYTTSGLTARDVAERRHFAFCAGSPEEVLADDQTQAVIIATRHASHAELAEKALRAGKTVFVEKPLAMTEEQLAAVAAAQRETGGRLTVGFNRRFSPLSQALKAELSRRSSPVALLIRVNAGAIAPTHWIQRLEEGGGRIVGEMCHFVDLAAYLAGSQPVSVFARSADVDRPPALSDTLTATLTFADGSIATLLYAATGDTTYPKERVEAYSEGRVFVIDDFRTLVVTRGGRTGTNNLHRQDKGHAAEMAALLDLAGGKDVPALTFADCVSSMAATFKVVESLATGLPVAVPTVTTEAVTVEAPAGAGADAGADAATAEA